MLKIREFSSADDIEREWIARETNMVQDQQYQTSNIMFESRYHLPVEWVEVAS